jgi:hypothetical protein
MRIFITGLTVLTVSSFFSLAFAQNQLNKNTTPAIKTPSTQKEFIETPEQKKVEIETEKSEISEPMNNPSPVTGSPAVRKLRQHSVGLGIGQTFLLGKFSDYGTSKISGDILYTYSASYSFDLLVNAHYSNHSDKKERVSLMGINTAIKSRVFEFDNFSPYILGGLGFYGPKVRREINANPTWSDRKIVFGMNFGAGVDLRLNEQYVIGVLSQLHWPFNSNQTNQSDVKGYYLKLLMTISYLF